MNNSPDDSQSRAIQPRQRGIPIPPNMPFQGPPEQLNGEIGPTSGRAAGEGGDTSIPAINNNTPTATPGQDVPRTAPPPPPTGEGNQGAPEDVAFESFHRSFTIGANVLDNLGNTVRPGYGPPPDNTNAPPVASETQVNVDQASPMDPSPMPAGMRTAAAAAATAAARPGQQESYEAQLSQLNEDPTVVQARKSMMARTGDRHARGKLPGPTEGRFVAPDAGSLEPPLPNPRSSKRYIKKKKRLPDIVDGILRTDNPAPLKSDEHVITCTRCDKSLGAQKAAVAIRCDSCGQVNSASPGNRYHQSRYAAR